MTDRAARAVSSRRLSDSPIVTRVHDHRAEQIAARATSSELRRALDGQRVAMIIWRPADGRIVLANEAAAQLLGRPLEELIGSNVDEYVEPDQAAITKLALSTGAVDAYRARRHLRGHEDDVLYAWIRAVEVDGERFAITVLALGSELAGLGGAEIQSPFGAVVPVATGIVDDKWEIVTVTTDLREITGQAPADVRGRSLLQLLSEESANRVRELERANPAKPFALFPATFREPNVPELAACFLVGAPCRRKPRDRMFAFVGREHRATAGRTARERELEERLRRISAEVRAAGLIDLLGDVGVPPGKIGEELSTRQLEIMEMLVRGARVPTIARTLYISPSTVRNHLSTIYRRLNVHSQAELLDKLRAQAAGDD